MSGPACRLANSHAAPAPQVIVLPIFWNKRVEEKEAVIAAAEAVHELLEQVSLVLQPCPPLPARTAGGEPSVRAQAGIASGVDTTTTLAPGQKMRHWEERGVKVRVELGGAEVAAGTAVLAQAAAKAGDLATKSKHKVPSARPGAAGSGASCADHGAHAARPGAAACAASRARS